MIAEKNIIDDDADSRNLLKQKFLRRKKFEENLDQTASKIAVNRTKILSKKSEINLRENLERKDQLGKKKSAKNDVKKIYWQ